MDKPLIWLHGFVRTPPFSLAARLETGYLLRLLQQGETLSLPHSRPMSRIGQCCHELRITDSGRIWRIVYRLDADAVVIAEVFQKTTATTPHAIIALCKARFRNYDHASRQTQET